MDYINGRELFEELCVYIADCKEAVAQGNERPQVTNKIGEAITQIANRMITNFRFNGYSYKEEMVGDGILKCFRKIHLFDPSRGENAFAYASQIIWNEFLRRIKTEQYESSVKAKLVRHKMSSEFVEHGVDADAEDGSNAFVEFLKENDAYVDYIALKKDKVEKAPTLVHRNKTPYKSKAVVEVVEEIDLFAEEEFV
jgi:DNA-directed RNA polymerase specialized sigma subunit